VRPRGRTLPQALAVAALVLVLPAAASAHAYLIKTSPAASVVLTSPPRDVALTYDEAVEPRFAIISVTDSAGHSVTTGPVTRSPSNPDTLIVPLRRIPEGWYLVYWRAISVDGHPVQGAFTFALGPNQGPQPQFPVPHINETATTTPLLIARWAMFLTTMTAVGLFVFRLLIARPLVRRVRQTELRGVSLAFFVMSALALLAIPGYVEESTAIDSLRSFFAFGALVPLWRTTAFGRGYVDLELCFALFAFAAAVAIWLDRPEQPRRSIGAIFAAAGALAAAAAVLALPGISGHAAQTAPRAVAVMLDWLHLISASIWIGGLVGLLVLWRSLPVGRRVAGLIVCVPRFSNVALVSVLLLIATGTGATVLHLPVVQALWQTSYGKAILVKIGLLTVAALLAAGNLLRSKPRLVAARSRTELGEPAARLLRRLVSGEAALIASAIFAAAVLSSLAPPPPAFAKEGSALAKVGPGKVAAVVHQAGYTLQLVVTPNVAAAPNSFELVVTKGGTPVRHANVTLGFAMLDMEMPNQEYQLTETRPGVYARSAPALVMVGHWALDFTITPAGGQPFSALVVDHAAG
jgi:copper transport protein